MMERDSQTCRFLTDVVNLTLNSNRSKSECSRMKEHAVMFEDLGVPKDLNKTDFFKFREKPYNIYIFLGHYKRWFLSTHCQLSVIKSATVKFQEDILSGIKWPIIFAIKCIRWLVGHECLIQMQKNKQTKQWKHVVFILIYQINWWKCSFD